MQPKRGASQPQSAKMLVRFDEYFLKTGVLFTFYSYLWCKIFYKECVFRARIIIKRKIFDEKEKKQDLLRHSDTTDNNRGGVHFKVCCRDRVARLRVGALYLKATHKPCRMDNRNRRRIHVFKGHILRKTE